MKKMQMSRFINTELKSDSELDSEKDISISTLHCRDSSIFHLVTFICVHTKKRKSANKRIRYFFLLRCFLSAFFILVWLFAFSCVCLVTFFCFLCFLCFFAFGAFWCFWCMRNLFVKKNNNKEFKNTLITPFILLLRALSITHSSSGRSS